MTQQVPDWIHHGRGATPNVDWTVSTEAPLVALQMGRETGEVLAADEAGGLYLINRAGAISAVSRGRAPIRAIAWGDTGGGGIALVGKRTLYWFNRGLKFDRKVVLSDRALNVALDAHAEYAVVSLEGGQNLIFDSPRKPIHDFTTYQPLAHLEFLVHEPAIFGVSAFGMFYKFEFSGNEIWGENLWSDVGGLSVSGNGSTILLACFAHGIQRYTGDGQSDGSYQLGETVSRISSSFNPYRMMAATIEQQLCWLDFQGQVLWSAATPHKTVAIHCDPLGYGAVCGFESGEIIRLSWD